MPLFLEIFLCTPLFWAIFPLYATYFGHLVDAIIALYPMHFVAMGTGGGTPNYRREIFYTILLTLRYNVAPCWPAISNLR